MARLYDWVYQLTAIKRPTGNVGSSPPYFQNTGQQITFGGVAPAGVPTPQLRIQFEVKRNLGKQPNSTKLVISNASKQTRQFIEAKPTSILIKMVSSADTGFFYVAKKNPRTKTEKLELKKYDPVARKHVVFKESKIK